ncbi:MAG: TIGR01777 family protein [Bacteroidetes bacterium CG2_30_33_31]|nr:MAG: TIGR01777 family protein [Bacteroidetes bacterium CG2_30_33_31]
MSKILICGGSGLVGKNLCGSLQDRGYEVAIMSRTKNLYPSIPTYLWDLNKNEIDTKALNEAEIIINLAGVNIGEKKWSHKRKNEIVDSRVKSGELIFNSISKTNNKLKVFITASAIGYYGSTTSKIIFEEESKAADDFLGKTCKKWEQVNDKFINIGIRTVAIRTAVVLTKEGGALSKIIMPIKIGIGSAIGNGKQYFPWIHIIDLCGIYIKAIEDQKMTGAYNAVAPEHITNQEFTKKVAQTLKKPFWFPKIPAIFMKLIFGEMAVILLEGSRVSSEKIRASSYKFLHPKVDLALKDLLVNK